jgi:hypothetical protein
VEERQGGAVVRNRPLSPQSLGSNPFRSLDVPICKRETIIMELTAGGCHEDELVYLKLF